MIYHIEWTEPTCSDPYGSSLSVSDPWSAARIAAVKTAIPGAVVSVFGQSHDCAGMHHVPESEWREWL